MKKYIKYPKFNALYNTQHVKQFFIELLYIYIFLFKLYSEKHEFACENPQSTYNYNL